MSKKSESKILSKSLLEINPQSDDGQLVLANNKVTKVEDDVKLREFALKIHALYPDLLNYAIYLTKDKYQAEDLLSNAVYSALKNADSYKEGNSLKSYLNSIIHNIFINNYRRAKLELSYLNDLSQHTDSSPTQLESYASTIKLLEHLDPTTQQIIFLVDLLNYKYQEVAKILDIPAGTVMSKLNRGRVKLRKQLIASGI